MAYIDKIDPAMPEGRIIIRSGNILLKDPGAETSPVHLKQKAYILIEFIKKKGYSEKETQSYLDSLTLIEQSNSCRNVESYNRLRWKHFGYRSQLMFWLLFDFYDVLPTSRKYYPSDYDDLQRPYRVVLDDGMTAGLSSGLRRSSISIEAASTAAYFLFLQELGVESIYDMSEEHLFAYMKSGKCGQLTIYRIGLFIKRLAECRYDQNLHHIASLFPKQRVQKKVYPAMSHEERQTLEAFLLNEDAPISRLDRAIGVTLLYTGMRCEDVYNLKMKDIDWHKDVIVFHQDKCLNTNMIPLRPIVGNAIISYITYERPQCGSEFLFISKHKVHGQYQRLAIQKRVNSLYEAAGIRRGKQRKGTHLLRHSFADELINSGSDLSVVSKLLGHSVPETTLGYLSANVEQLRQCALDVSDYPITHKLYRP